MKAVVEFMVILLGVSHGVETHCDGRQDGAQCYGALGGTVDIQLMDSTSEISRYGLLKNSLKILDVREKMILSNTIVHRSVFFPSNGTFRITNLSRTDSGDYTLQTFDSDGKSSGVQILQLFFQAPVSSVLLVSECLSQGEMRVSCSSEGGDNPQYSWTLDGRTLTDAEILSGNMKTNVITLKQHVSGHLACSVKNLVSKVSKEQRLSTCGFIFINCTSVNGTQVSGWVYEANNTLCIEPTTEPSTTPQTAVEIGHLPLISGVLSTLIIFLVVVVAAVCAQRKKQNSKTKEEENDQEEIFADLRVVKQQAKQLEKRAELEFCRVKYSKRPRQTEPTIDDCLYVNVHKFR
ncbi:hepatocyte cell adhesion molecule-like isoform X2 [Simochromis diagramma]|uniref:hepatocyte cell adhesion molecule-like isoform X2 n=1 Tax=Simochromis diagramma TaxID=43689 RepID=UPI001A7EA0A1|nr:hepatocyte cell adhesion molecule-like isoform X2 [Simochromis diagramma]